MKFIDEAKIFLRSGDGGNGCVGFRREKYIANGGPNGGDGGRGGSIIFICNPNLNTLLSFRYKQHFRAQVGEGGKGSNRTGKSADDLFIEVPLGTQIYDEDGEYLLFDFVSVDDEFVAAVGGRGGLGNAHFKTSVNQAPRQFTKGTSGEELCVRLKLKVLADVGIIGLPNAGKSTFLSCITQARPKIADYPFTTLSPQLGVAEIDNETLVLADIPGLIEGAHDGHGLGDKFLKHIERCSILVHLIDVTSENLLLDYNTIRAELSAYSDKLVAKREIVVLTKIDLIDHADVTNIVNELSKKLTCDVYAISSAAHYGMSDLLYVIFTEHKIYRDLLTKSAA